MGKFLWGCVISVSLLLWVQECCIPKSPQQIEQAKKQQKQFEESERRRRIDECKPIKVTETSDGTALYKVSESCVYIDVYPVYFSSGGTQTLIREQHWCGKHPCSREVPVSVPNSNEEGSQ